MPQLGATTLLVREYDEAIAWFTEALGMQLLEDASRDAGKRWVRVGWEQPGTCSILLARAATPEQRAQVGRQAGGRVSFFLHTDDFRRDHDRFQRAGVRFLEAPRHEPYGTVAVFEDLYGNRWDLIEPRSGSA